MRVVLGALLAATVIAIACSGSSGIDDRGLATDCNPESNAPARAEGETFVTTSGVNVVVVTEAPEEDTAQANDSVSVHFTGSLTDGTQFGGSREQLGTTFEFRIRTENVICGWVEGLVGMSPGEVRELTIPPELAYGHLGFGDLIPPDATVVFEVEMIEFVQAPPVGVQP